MFDFKQGVVGVEGAGMGWGWGWERGWGAPGRWLASRTRTTNQCALTHIAASMCAPILLANHLPGAPHPRSQPHPHPCPPLPPPLLPAEIKPSCDTGSCDTRTTLLFIFCRHNAKLIYFALYGVIPSSFMVCTCISFFSFFLREGGSITPEFNFEGKSRSEHHLHPKQEVPPHPWMYTCADMLWCLYGQKPTQHTTTTRSISASWRVTLPRVVRWV